MEPQKAAYSINVGAFSIKNKFVSKSETFILDVNAMLFLFTYAINSSIESERIKKLM